MGNTPGLAALAQKRLEALHLASALVGRSAVPGLDLLSLDDRIRTAANRLGFRLQPE